MTAPSQAGGCYLPAIASTAISKAAATTHPAATAHTMPLNTSHSRRRT